MSGELRRVVIVGAGIAGLKVAEGLRRESFTGDVIMIGDESYAPYDRPSLSKDVLTGKAQAEDIFIRPLERFSQLGVELMLGQRAQAADLKGRILLTDASEIPFDGLVIATGSSARRLSGADFDQGTLSLRTLDDALQLRAVLCSARHVTIVGAGFIGSEVAAAASGLGCEVTLVEMDAFPLGRVVRPEVGASLGRIHDAHGIDFRPSTRLAALRQGRARLSDGSEFSTDVVVAGVGASPNTEWLKESGLTIRDGIVCDASLNAGPPGIFAVGDVVNWPNSLFGERMRVEHWTNASAQGAVVAHNLLHQASEHFARPNYVWSDQYGIRIQLVGLTTGPDFEVVSGSLSSQTFLVWHRTNNRLVGACAVGCPEMGLKSADLIASRTPWPDAVAALE